MSTEEQIKEIQVTEKKETNEPTEQGHFIEEEGGDSGLSSSESSNYSSDVEKADRHEGLDIFEPMSKRDALRQCRRTGNTMPMVQYRRYRERRAQEVLKKMTEKKEEEKE